MLIHSMDCDEGPGAHLICQNSIFRTWPISTLHTPGGGFLWNIWLSVSGMLNWNGVILFQNQIIYVIFPTLFRPESLFSRSKLFKNNIQFQAMVPQSTKPHPFSHLNGLILYPGSEATNAHWDFTLASAKIFVDNLVLTIVGQLHWSDVDPLHGLRWGTWCPLDLSEGRTQRNLGRFMESSRITGWQR